MAHQNLKFQVNPKKSDIWQPVFGGQAHGTFFMLYIRFHDFDAVKQHKDGTYHYTCDFKIQNFRGAITMGLTDIEPKTELKEVEDLKDAGPITHIKVGVKPFTKKDEITNTTITLSQPITNGFLSVIQLELKNPPKNLFDPNDLENSKYINPYTHFRDGDEFDEVTRRKVGETEWPTPANMSGWGMGFCLPDIIIFLFG